MTFFGAWDREFDMVFTKNDEFGESNVDKDGNKLTTEENLK